jgi:arginyl-tRNA synthetase
MGTNLFDELDGIEGGEGSRAEWAARAPFQPEDRYDLMLIPRVPGWRDDPGSQRALELIEAEPSVAAVLRDDDGIHVRLTDEWIERTGAALEEQGVDGHFTDLAAEQRYAVYFWGANTTKALHVGHLRNLAVGNAIGAALAQAGGRVEHRSLICDVGRSMGEAMAGVFTSGEEAEVEPSAKSDHFVGACYAEYVRAGRAGNELFEDDGAEDSVARESTMYKDKADELMMRVLSGDQQALELWSKTRAWVIAGQRKTLSRLGVAFDKVIFESDFLPEVAELANQGLAEGTLTRRYGDDMVMYETEREELEEMPLVRSDGLPTQHMRALAYWSAAPELDDVISMQVCGNEWVAHVTCRRQLIDELGVANGNGYGSARGGGPPTHDIFHGMVARDRQSVSSSKKGALLIDSLVEQLEERIGAEPEAAAVGSRHPDPDHLPAQVALGYFLLQPTTKQVDFGTERLLLAGQESLGWDLARAQAQRGGSARLAGERPAEDPDYRFAVVQSEMHRRHLRKAVDKYDVAPLARYISHFARWYTEQERPPEVERIVQTVLGRGARGLGLEAA